MAAAIGLRDDYDAGALRAAAKRSKDGPQARRQLALGGDLRQGHAHRGGERSAASDCRWFADWVMKFNADGTGKEP